jgi:hypothetical protein
LWIFSPKGTTFFLEGKSLKDEEEEKSRKGKKIKGAKAEAVCRS